MDVFERFKALADRKKHVYDEDIEALVDEKRATAHDRIKLVSLSVIAGTRGPQRATMKIEMDGRIFTAEAGSAPRAVTERSPAFSRTETSAWASVPSVTAWT
jgi:2-isopropylmalate synthase